MVDKNNKQKLYEALSADYDMGSFEQFSTDVEDEAKRQKLYDAIKDEYELPDFNQFTEQLVGAKQQRETAAAKGDAEGASTFSEAEIKAETAAAEPQQVNDLPIPPTQGKSTSGTPTPGAWPYAGAHRMQDGYVVSNAPGRDTGWRLNNEDGTPRTWAENVEAAKTDEQRAIEQFGDYRSGIVQDLLTDHAKTKAVPSERVVVDSEGNEVDRYEVTPELSQEEAEYQARDDYYKKVKLDGERWAELEAARKQVYDEYNKELGKAHKEISELYQYVDAGAPLDIYDKVSNRREVKALQGALKYYDDALTMVKEARAVNDSPNNFLGELAGLGRGLLDAGLDVSTWDMGMSDLDQGASTLSAILKLEAGKELTSAEQRLLAAAAANTYANSSLGEQMGMGYKAGQTTMMSVPFMIEMALNPASGLGSAGSKALSKHLIKKYGREMIQKQLKKRLARQAMAAKWATKVGGDAASAIDMTLTSGAAMTAADAVDRMTGTIKPTEDEEGNIVYGGREDYEKSALTAGFKAVASGAIERQTEMVGGYIPAMKTAGVTFLGKAAKKATNPRLRKIYREAEELLDGKAFGKWGEMVGKVADVTKLNDLAGEFLEEKIGEVENAILVGDMKFDANSQTGIFNLDRNIETLVGLLPMQTFFGGMTLLGYRTQKYRTNQALNKANKAAWETFGEDWIEMKDMIDGCETDKDLTKVVRGIISGGTTDLRSQAAVMQYVSAVQRQKGLQLVAETAPEIVAQAEAEDAAAAAMPQTTENGGAVDAAAIPQPTENGGAVLQTAYDRGVAAAEADDYAAISDIGYQADLADARIERMFDEAQRAEIAEAENTEGGLETWLGNNRESLSAEQAFAVQALIDANDAYDGLTETVRHRSASEEDAIRQEMQPLATADGRIVPLTLDNGQTVYLKSGDPTNRRSTVIAAYRDETGAVRNTQVSGMSITSIGTEQSLSDYALEAMGNINNERQQRIKDAMDGKNVAAGQTVRLYAGDELQEYEATAVAPEGVTLRSRQDGSEMTMTTEELQDELAMSRQKRIENDLAAAAMPQPTENTGAAVAAAAMPQLTEAAKEEERRKPLRARVAQWSKDIGADIEIHEDTNSITSSAVLNQINSGQGRVRGWYDNATGKVHVYMPGITDEHDIDETVIHEIVAHKGLRQLMGPRFDALCDKVYEMMSEDARKKYLAYPGVNGDTRAAADEYMAYLAENMENLTAEEQNVWQTIVAAVREFIKSVMSGSQMTDAQIEQLIRASYLNMKAQREQATEAAAEPQLTENTRAAAAEREQEPAATDQQLAEKENLESQENAEKNVSLQTKEGRMGVVARQKNSAARLAKAKEIYGSDPTTAPFFDDMDVPQTAEELVAMTLVPRSINWEGIDRGTQHIRGLQEEMGRNKKRGIGRNFDTYGFNPYLAKKGEGVGIEKLVEDIWRSDKNGMGEGNMLGDQRRFDEHEIKDALLSLLSGAQTPKDISDYVLNNRIAQAEAAIEYMEEEATYEQELYEQERREDARLAGILEMTDADWLQMEAEYADKIAEIEAKEREQREIFQQILEQDHQQVEYYGRANEEVASERGIRMAEESAERGTAANAERGETVLRGAQDTREEGLSVGDAELSEGALGAQDGRDGRSEDVHTQEAERSAVGETEAVPQFTEELERQKAETNTSPTEAQKEAGNYKKGHLTFGGYKFTIENPKGSVRSGKDKKGKAWKVTMPVTYGYILGKKGKDGDHLDMFINDNADLSTWDGEVFVIDQVNPETGKFDEHKVMYGFNNITDAMRAYLMSYTRPWRGMGNVTGVSKEKFDEWVASSDRKLKPFAETRFGDKADVGTKVIRAAEERAGKRQEGEAPELDRDKQIEKAYKRGYNSYRQEQYTDETLLEMYASMSNEAIEADISKMEQSIEEEKAYKDSEEYQERRSNESSDYTRAQTEGVAARAGKSVKALETKIAEAKKVLELRDERGEGLNDTDGVNNPGNIRFRFSNTPEEFEATQKEAVEKKGILMDGLNDAVVNIVDVPRHDFTGRGIDAINKAREWANKNINKEHTYHEGQDDEFKYKIDDDAIDKFLSSSSTKASDNLGVHLAVLKKLPEVIDNSIDVEIHPDYKKKDGKRLPENGVGRQDMLVHRMYGAVDIDGKIYCAKTTIHEFKDKDNEAYTYKITEVKLIVSGSTTSNARTNSTSISAANLLKDVEKSYEPGKKVLDESEDLTFEQEKGGKISFSVKPLAGNRNLTKGLRELEEGETCQVERIFTENKNFEFSSVNKVESYDDIAYIFKQLEDEAVENSFAVLVKRGKPTVIHLGMGNYTATMVNQGVLNVAVNRVKPDKIYFVHNHPSGQLRASNEDIRVWQNLWEQYGSKLANGIIINTRSGKYGIFNDERSFDIATPSTSDADSKPLKVYSFNKQVFSKDYKPEGQIFSSEDVAKFVSSHRLGDRQKLGLILANNKEITGNIFLPYSEITTYNARAIANDIIYYTSVMGGTRAFMFGNVPLKDIQNKGISDLVAEFSGLRLLDYIEIDGGRYKSAADEGVRFSVANDNQEIFVSNAEQAVKGIKQEKATPQQWKAMIQSKGGLKAGEGKWLGLSEWLDEKAKAAEANGSNKANVITKQEVLDFIGENKIRIEEVEYGENADEMPAEAEQRLAELNSEYEELIWEGEEATGSMYANDWADYAYEQMVNRYGDDFRNAFDTEGIGTASKLVPSENYDGMSDEAKYFLDIEGTGNAINSTRLEYTTEGLENKREIALTVPTIESWNESDDIHFGDAGQGRAVAWARFGETFTYETVNDVQEVTEFHKPYENVNRQDVYKPVGSFKSGDYVVHGKGRDGNMIYVVYINDKQLPVAHATLDDARNAMNEYYKENPRKLRKPLSVLVIDEIQSKRHQEGREKGYRGSFKVDEQKVKELRDELSAARKRKKDIVPDEITGIIERAAYRKSLSEDLQAELRSLEAREQQITMEIGNLTRIPNGIPDAPFDKNWHELAMKRMLRLAAEEGFDKVAWTKGEQQAERYNLGGRVDEIKVTGGYDGIFSVIGRKDGGILVQKDVEGEQGLADMIGKDLARKAYSNLKEGKEDYLNEDGAVSFTGDNLSIGGEGMKGFYDDILPRFMNKYGKKWGVKVEEVELPEVEEAGRKMWSVDVTPEMKESVMEGQVMFRTKKSFEAGSRYEVKERVYNYYESEELDYYESEELVTGAYQTPHQLLEAVRNKHEGYAWKMNDDATEIECLGRWNELLPKKNGRNDGDDNNERIAKKTERAKAMIGDVAKMLGLDVEVLEDTDNLTDKKKTAKGWYDVTSGKITVVLPNHTSNADVMATLLHEGVAHHGLRKMFGEEFDNMLDNVYVKAWAQGKINAIAGENASKERIREATEEYLARLAEDMNFEKATEQKWWDYIRQAFVSMLRKAGVTIDVMLTDNELRYLLWRSYQNLKESAGKRTALETMEDHKKQKRLGVYDGTGRIEPAVAVAEDIRFRFVGEQGAANLDKAEEATTRLDNLNVARQMEEAGKDAKSIKMATGWERGADKKWRYEVDDDIKIDLSANVDFRRRHPEYARYEELKNKELAAVLELGEPMTEEEHKEYDFAKTIFGGDTELHRSRKLKDYVESESLFKNYPELAAYSLNIVDEMEDGASGSFNPDTKTVTLKMSFKVGEMEEVLVHELQHAIQHIEGFAQGGNTRSVQTKAETLKKDVQPLYEMIHDTPEWAEYKMLVNDYFDEYGKDQLDNDKIAEIENRLNEIEDSGVLKEIENKRKELKRKYGADATVTKILNGPFSSFDEIWEQLPSGFYDKFDAYYRLGGEVEARNAAERMGMTAEERRASLASETEDVAREDQVFIFDGLESAAMPQSTKLSASNKAVAMYDKANGTNVKGFFNYLRNNKQAKKGEPTSFHIGNAGSLLEQYGIKGKFMVGQFTFSKEHTDNEDHHLSVNDWVNVINNLNNPLAITSYKGMPNQYRIYTYAMINGKNICVGVNVSLADGEIALSNIISAYGRDINMLLGKEKTNLIYPDIEELKRRISQVSTGHDSPLNATSTASGDKGTEKDSDLQGNDEKNVTRLSWKEGSEKPNSEVSADELRYRESSIEEFGESFGGTKVQFADRERFADDADAMERIERGDKGWYDTATGEVVIITENCADEADMARALLHEKLGHEGLAALFGGEKGVMKWGEYIWKSASESLRKRIAQRADKEGYPLSDRNRWSKAAQEVFADMASEGTMSNDEYSLWTKARHYVYRALKALNIRIPGSMTDADLRYYVKKTAEALKKTAAEPQTTENREHYEGSRMAARGDGRPRKKRNESQAQYNQRLLEWERRQVANENDPAPEMPELSAEEIRQEYNEYQKGWMARHGLPEDYEPGVTVGDENAQIFDREKHDSNDPYIEMLGYIPEAMRRWREEYHAWEQRNALGEAENVDLLLYNGDSSHRPDDSTSMEAEARLGNTLRERTIFDEISEAVGFDNTPEGAKRHAKNAVINRRKELESASAEDAIFIQGLGKKIEGIAKRLNVKSKDVRSALITLIELPIMRKNKEQAEQEALETINTSEAMNNAHTKLTLDNLRELREQIGDMLSKHVRHKEDQNNQEKWNELYEAAMTLSAALNQMNAGNEGYVALYADDVIAAYKQFEAAYAATAELPSSELLDKLENDETTKELLGEIKDWYDLMYHYIENAGLRGDAGYIAEGYVNHIWDKSKSDPEAYDRYVRLKSANMRHREIPTYADGIAVGLVPKFTDILDIMSYYSRQNIEAVSNRHLLDNLLNLCVDVKNTDGEVVQQLPVVTTASPSFGDRSRYERYEIPGISGDVWVLKDVKGWFNAIFGTERTPGIGPKMRSAAKAYDVLSGILKTIQLSFSFFHAGALTEVSVAQQGPIKGFKDILKYIIVESALKGTMPAYAHPADFKLAASHLVQLGATKDYAAAEVAGFYDKIHEVMQDFRKEHPNPLTWTGELAAALPKYLNKGMSIMLWEYLHDGLKIALFKKLAGDVDKRLLHIYNTGQQGTNQYEDFVTWQESKAYRVLREQMLDEAGQYVNDTFGGQYWELMNVSPTLIKWLRRALLSPDWLISTQRHFFSMFGFGSLYSEGSFREWIKYNTDNLQRLLGKDVPRNELRRMRSKNAKICYLIGVTIFYYAAFNIINAIARAWDEDEEKKKAEEIRKTNPDYKSPYELAYPDGMKWWEYTMLGNSPRHETHLFLGRYEDGTEYYVRWGKQFREFPELFIGKNGFEFPGPLIERMKGKSNPLLRYTEGAFGVLDIHGYNAPYDIQEMRDKYGKEITLLAYTAQQFLPFSVPTQKDKEFKLLDLAMPSQKGFTRWKAVNYFEDFIVSGEMDGIERTYKAAVMNGINAEECLQAAIARVKATQRKEMGDGITDLQGAYERFDASKDLAERKLMRQKMRKYLSQSGWKNFSKADAVEKVQEFINGGKDYEANNGANDSYLMAATAADIAEDWRIDSLYQLTSPIAKELKDMQNAGMSAQEVNAYAKNHEKLLEARKMIGYHRRVVNILKRDIALHKDSAMTNIREKRKELLKTLGENKPENR